MPTDAPTWDQTEAIDTPAWDETTPEEAAPAPVVTPELLAARKPLTPNQEAIRQAQLTGEAGPFTGMLGPRKSEKAAEAIQLFQSLQEPPLRIPRIQGKSTLGKIGAGIVNTAAGLGESVASPVGLLTLPAFGKVAPPIISAAGRGVFAGLAAKAAGEAAGRARVTKDPQDITEAALLTAVAPLVIGRPIEAAPEMQGPLATGQVLPMPPGARRPITAPPEAIARTTPEEAAAAASRMQRTATAAYEPPRPGRPIVPEGPLEAPPTAPAPPAAPRELASWDDFVAHLSRNGTGLETRAQIRAMFKDSVPNMSGEAAARLARDAFGTEWAPGGKPAVTPPRVAPAEAPIVKPVAQTPVSPATITPPVEPEWMGRPVSAWEEIKTPADLPKGADRRRLANSLGVEDAPSKILAAIRKRTAEIRASAAKPPTPPEEPPAPAGAPVPKPTPPVAPAAPAAEPVPPPTPETVTLYSGKGGAGGAGQGEAWFTGNLEKARSYGPEVKAVQVPKEVAEEAKAAAQQQGQGGDTYFLKREHADKAKLITPPPPKITDLTSTLEAAEEKAAASKGPEQHSKDMDLARRLVDMTPDEFLKSASGFNKANLRLGSEATPAELAELVKLKEKADARVQKALEATVDAKTPEEKEATAAEFAIVSTLPQFYAEALARARKVAIRNATAKAPEAAAPAAATEQKPTPPTEPPPAAVHITAPPTTPPPGASFFAAPAQNPFGSVPPAAVAMSRVFAEFWKPLASLGEAVRLRWRAFANQSVPRLTAADRETGEAAARMEAAGRAGAQMGDLFADKVLEGVKEPLTDGKWGTAVTEDNLRDLKRQFQERSDEASDPESYIDDLRQQAAELKEAADDGDPEARKALAAVQKDIKRIKAYTPEDAQAFQDQADSVQTMIGAKMSPFPTEESYQAFLASPEVQTIIIPRHRQLWRETKDPVYRLANDLEPDMPLETRGLQTGARINLKAVLPGDKPTFPVGGAGGGPLIRQARTFLRRDPFGRPATGAAPVYEGSYRELMRNGFAREYPVAAQHDFINRLIATGNAVTSNREVDPNLRVRGEETKGFELRLRPWVDRPQRVWLHVPKSLAREYQRVTGLERPVNLPVYTKTAQIFTWHSVQALAEGMTHSVNMFTRLLRLGPTANPLINTLIDVGKSAGAGGLPVDLLYTIPRVLQKGFSKQTEAMLDLTKISATKQPYGGALGLGWLLNRFDQGIRLVAAENYKAMAKARRVPDTETGLREYVNQMGQYNRAMQPIYISFLRSTGIQPFATAVHTFNVQALRQATMSPGIKASTTGWAAAMRIEQAAKFGAFVALLGTIQSWLTPGQSKPPKGTALGAVGWIDPKDGKLHSFDVGGLFGYTRLFNMTGVGPYLQARQVGLPKGTAVEQGLNAVGTAGLRYITGPLNQAIAIGKTGKRPGFPMVREAPVVPPQQQTDSLEPLKTQAAANIETSLIRANPFLSTYADIKDGKSWEEIRRRQLLRFTPKTGPSEQMIEALPKIAETREMRDYTDYLATQARKLPLSERSKWVIDRLERDKVSGQDWRQAWQNLHKKGLFKYP